MEGLGADPERSASYPTIYRVLRILGSATIVSAAVSLVRNKLLAILIGPLGYGALTTLQSVIAMGANVGGFGAGYSATRLISSAKSRARHRIARMYERELERLGFKLAWATSAVTAVALWLFSAWYSQAFMDGLSIAAVSIGAGFAILASLELTRLQVRRKPGPLAMASVMSAVSYTAVAVVLGYGFGPAAAGLIAAGLPLATWAGARYFVLRGGDETPPPRTRRGVQWAIVRRGAPLMLPGLLDAATNLGIRLAGAAALGLSQMGGVFAALALSSFILGLAISAMNQDFFPRLCEARGDPSLLQRTVSEQLLVTVQLSAPIFLLLSAFPAEWMALFFSKEFVPSSELVPVMAMLGLGTIMLWPIHTAQTALGHSSAQLGGAAANGAFALILIFASWNALTPLAFAGILLAAEFLQLAVQAALLRRSAQVAYGPRDLMAPGAVLASLIVLLLLRQDPIVMHVVGTCMTLVSGFIAIRHYLVHSRER